MRLSIYSVHLYQRRDYDTGVSLWILRSFSEHLFYRTLPTTGYFRNHSFCLLSHFDPLPCKVRCHPYFPADYFLGRIYRQGTRVSSIFQTLYLITEVKLEKSKGKIINELILDSQLLKEIGWNLKLEASTNSPYTVVSFRLNI